MKIFLQSESAEGLRDVAREGLLDGVVLSWTNLVDETWGSTVFESVEALAGEFAVPVCIPVSSITPDDVYREGRELARISDLAIVQVPFLEDTVLPIRKLVDDGVRVCANYVYTGVQAFLAAKIGATMVMAHVDDLDAHGSQSALHVAEIRSVIDSGQLECDLIVASPRSSTHFTECLLAGADTVCTSADMLKSFMVHALTDRGVDRLLSNLSKRHRPRSI